MDGNLCEELWWPETMGISISQIYSKVYDLFTYNKYPQRVKMYDIVWDKSI